MEDTLPSRLEAAANTLKHAPGHADLDEIRGLLRAAATLTAAFTTMLPPEHLTIERPPDGSWDYFTITIRTSIDREALAEILELVSEKLLLPRASRPVVPHHPAAFNAHQAHNIKSFLVM